MTQRDKLLSAALTVTLSLALGAHASAKAVVDKAKSAVVADSLGIRLLTAPQQRAEGRSIEAQVVNSERFSGKGFPGAKQGDRVTVQVLSETRGRITHVATDKSHVFKVKSDSEVERELGLLAPDEGPREGSGQPGPQQPTERAEARGEQGEHGHLEHVHDDVG